MSYEPGADLLDKGRIYRLAFPTDAHGVFADPYAWALALEVLHGFQPDIVLWGSDAMDFGTISRHSKHMHLPSIQEELDDEKKRRAELSASAAGATLWWLQDNHTTSRYYKYLWAKAPELAEVKKLAFEEIIDFPAHRVISEYHAGRTLRVIHGATVRKWPGWSVLDEIQQPDNRHGRLVHSVMSGHCFDEETEILTPDGWKKHNELFPGSRVMTYNRTKKVLEYQPAQEVLRYTDFNELVHIHGRDIDLAVTGDHGLWTRYHGAKNWREKTAEQAFGQPSQFKLAAPHKEAPGVALTDAQIRLVAWIMAEGHIGTARHRDYPEAQHFGGITIAQSDHDGKLEKLETCLKEAGVSFNRRLRYKAGATEHGTHRNYDAYRYRLVKPMRSGLTTWLFEYLTREKTPTRKLAQMSIAQIKVFLQTYIWADGCKNSAARFSYQIGSKRVDHIDFLQELACRAGWRSSVGRKIHPVNNDWMYWITLNERSTTEVQISSWSRQPYSGTAWCVTVPNGTLLVRRGGHTAITLNCHRFGYVALADGVEGLECGCLMNLMPGYMRDARRRTDWVHGMGLALFGEDWSEIIPVRFLVKGNQLSCRVMGQHYQVRLGKDYSGL